MVRRSLDQWLSWQESLHHEKIELGLDRVAAVRDRLSLGRPTGGVLTVGGTNGKGSTVRFIELLLSSAGCATGAYTSPHLIRYNERVRLRCAAIDDSKLVDACERVEAARADTPLTYFEFGTLAALCALDAADLDYWILEVGLGGRLDAVNVIDPDVSVITTIDLDHQAWLGETLAEIAAEKAGIMRAGRPALFGDVAVPGAIVTAAEACGAELRLAGFHFKIERGESGLRWQGAGAELENLPEPPPGDAVQLRNLSLALASIECLQGMTLTPALVESALAAEPLPGRFQRFTDEHDWIFDVAHNGQAAMLLGERLAQLTAAEQVTCVLGLLYDKPTECFVAALEAQIDLWLACTCDGARARSADALARELKQLGAAPVHAGGTVQDALAKARSLTPDGGRIVVAGSFQCVGPALTWLGLY